MCGFLFLDQHDPERISMAAFKLTFDRQQWRGPDAQHVAVYDEGRVIIGHHRLSILDPGSHADQPMVSSNGRYVIVYNGEIYNHLHVRKCIDAPFLTQCDTETILEGYALLGNKIFELIDGMFSLVIHDTRTGDWIAARDRFGTKPLFLSRNVHGCIIGSEPAGVAELTGASPCSLALSEWRLIRRPLPGTSFFSGVEEILPGTIVARDGTQTRYWSIAPSTEPYDQDQFNELLINAIKQHELSDVKNVSLLSGGLDSAVITAVSGVRRSYSVGLPNNNEFSAAADTARMLGRELINIEISTEELVESWRHLAQIRREPLGLPNEGLIYAACKHMDREEKVVLTGEGADELLFGYDGIFKWARNQSWQGATDFLRRYGYSDNEMPTERLCNYMEMLHKDKSNVDFVEDFFYAVHLPGLLRRMDFASMAASKEARVPFVSRNLIEYMYRRPYETKIFGDESKLPLRVFAKTLGLEGALARKKIGFSAQTSQISTRHSEYQSFQNIVLGALQWS